MAEKIKRLETERIKESIEAELIGQGKKGEERQIESNKGEAEIHVTGAKKEKRSETDGITERGEEELT